MKVLDIVREGLGLARRNRSLWLFGFFLGLGSCGGGGGGGGQGAATPLAVGSAGSSILLLIAIPLVALLIAGLIMRLLSEGALIEGVRHIRRDEPLTVRQGLREGWAHAGVVLLIKLAYFAASAASVLLLALPCLIVLRLAGANALVLVLGILAVLVAVPWLVTLYIWQSFALRIAVLENRHAADAIAKARLFLHGRLLLGLKLMVATLLGTMFIALIGIVAIVPPALLLVGFADAFGPLSILLGLPLLVLAICIVLAIVGTYESSVWTLGYLRQIE